jgi:L-amino acid N-acyltransferase YncA
MPRPDKNYAGSTYSLPTLVSSINISDTGIGANGGQDAPDVRNTIGLRHNLRQAGDEWVQYNWDNPFGRDDNEALWESSYLGHFIKHWVAGIPDSPQVSFDQGGAEHWKCDIDTSRGVFLTPVLYPDSLVNHAEVDVTLEWRRQNWTSTLLMRRHNTNPRGNQRFGNNRRRNPRRDPEPELMDEDFIVEVQETPLERPEYNRYVPRIPCFLRPAEKFDMEAVRLIYNWEVEHGLQTLDSEPLSVEAFEKLLSTTQELGMPFIVAVRGSARDLGLTKGNLAFSVFKQIPFTEGKRGEILGFAFLSPWQPGLAGGLGSSRASAKLNVFVHPDYRRKKIGFSLLDMLLTTVSDCFSSQTGYDFIDPDDSPVYKNSPTRERQYFRLYISYMVKHQHRTDHKKLEAEQKKYDNDLVWVKKMLEDGLNFTELVRYKAAHRSSKAREGPVYWLDEVVFEHTCMFGPQGGRIKEDY